MITDKEGGRLYLEPHEHNPGSYLTRQTVPSNEMKRCKTRACKVKSIVAWMENNANVNNADQCNETCWNEKQLSCP
jgi:hypothetical protein